MGVEFQSVHGLCFTKVIIISGNGHLMLRHCPISTANTHAGVAVLRVAAKVVFSSLARPIRSRSEQPAVTNHILFSAVVTAIICGYIIFSQRSDEQTFSFLFATANGSLAERRPLANIHLSAITSNTSLIANVMGDIGYFLRFKKKTMDAAIFVRYSKRTNVLVGSRSKRMTSEQCSNKCAEEKTFTELLNTGYEFCSDLCKVLNR